MENGEVWKAIGGTTWPNEAPHPLAPTHQIYQYLEPINPNLICCICNDAFQRPFSAVTCGHTFCLQCISQALQTSQKCPIDRERLTLEMLRPAVQIVTNMVNELKVFCPNGEMGCTVVMERQGVRHHLERECEFALVACANEGCDLVARRAEVIQHAENCQFKRVTCQLCGEIVREKLLKTHKSEHCRAQIVSCEHCQANMARESLLNHIQDSCPMVKVNCNHQRFGCSHVCLRKDLSEHLITCPFEVIAPYLLAQEKKQMALERSVNELSTKLEQTILELNTLKSQNEQQQQEQQQQQENETDTSILHRENEQLHMENEQLLQQIEGLHEELRNHDAFRAGEAIRMREEIESLWSFYRILETRLQQVAQEKPVSKGTKSSNPSSSSSSSSNSSSNSSTTTNSNSFSPKRLSQNVQDNQKQGNKL